MRLGMDGATGLRVFPQAQGLAALAQPRGSQKTFETIDDAVKTILDTCYNEARAILSDKSAFVDRVAGELLEVETISRDRFVEIMKNPAMSGDPALPPIYTNASSI
jgi:cell division protease FtsH